MTDVTPQETTSLVIEYEVSKAKAEEFWQWQQSIQAEAIHQPGYVRTDICPPVEGAQNKWYIVVHFDSSTNLSRWLDSDHRHALIRHARSRFGDYQYRNLGTGLEGWFSQGKPGDKPGTSPPAWKQNLAVLFGLYPTVMVETLLFSHFGIMEGWSLAPKMFVNNLVSCSLLTWLVMPLVTRLLQFWLTPSSSLAKHTNLMGLLLVLLSYGLMISLFQAFS
jgi:antibiotic biosynthesis monooxygenase (ABM) superfamily enzyme